MLVTIPSKKGDNSTAPGVARIMHYPVYRPITGKGKWGETNYLVEHSDIVVFDHGVHYKASNEKADFHTQMQQFLVRFEELRTWKGVGNGKLKMLAWRETTSQHFNNTGGHFRGAPVGDKCVPMDHGDRNHAYHMTLMELACDSAGLDMLNPMSPGFSQKPLAENELIVLPFREFTSGLHKLHFRQDCTHYCHTPYVWLPLWRSLRVAMDRALK